MGDTPKAPPSLTLAALFFGFSKVGLSGFGGVLPFARRMLVEERGWLTAEEFNAMLGICQFLPGPNVVNLSVVVGARYRGVLGAVVAPVGLLLGPMLIVLVLGWLYGRYGQLPMAQSMLKGVAAIGVGLLFATAWRMAQAVRWKRWLLPFAGVTVGAIAFLRWPLPPVMAGLLLGAACVAAWRLRDDDDRR